MTASGGNQPLGKAVPGADHVPRPSAYAVILDDLGRVAGVRTGYGLFLPGAGCWKKGSDPFSLQRPRIALR
jgi:hypothetical protein